MFLKNLLESFAELLADPNASGKSIAKDAMEMFKDGIATFATYFTIALAGLLVIIGIIVWLVKKDNFSRYCKGATFFGVGYAFSVSALLLYGELQLMVVKGRIYDYVFYPVLATLIAVILLAAVGFTLYLVCPKAMKTYKWVALGVSSAALISVLVTLSIYFKDKIVSGGYYKVNNLGLILCAVIMVLALILIPIFVGKKSENSSRSISYGAVCIALSFALSYMRLFRLPQGGSITLASLVPLVFYSYKFGIKKGVAVGVIYGILQAIQDPYIIHPAQILLDYPIAFGGIGLAGLFKERHVTKLPIVNFLLGALLAVTFRYTSHVLSGIFAFSVYAFDAGFESVTLYSFLYNSFTLADMAVAMVVGCVMLTSRSFRKILEA